MRHGTRRSLAVLLLLLGASPTLGALPEITFDGSARTGGIAHTVQFRFFCSESQGQGVTGVLGVELFLVDYEKLHRIFDVDPFEGPDANAGAKSGLQASSAQGNGSGRFTAAGWIKTLQPVPIFALGVNAMRRGDAPRLKQLSDTLRPLTTGPAEMVWTQGQANGLGKQIIATLTLTGEQSGALKGVIGACLAK